MSAGTPPWERIEEEELHLRLRELSRRGDLRLFHPLDAGSYVVSAQASGTHASDPPAAVPASEVTAWEVVVFGPDGRQLSEVSDPELTSLPHEWLRYWHRGVGRFVPTPVLRVLLDRFSLGPEHFDRFILEDLDPG